MNWQFDIDLCKRQIVNSVESTKNMNIDSQLISNQHNLKKLHKQYIDTNPSFEDLLYQNMQDQE